MIRHFSVTRFCARLFLFRRAINDSLIIIIIIDCLEIIVSTLYILVLLNLMLRDTILKAAKILVDNAKKLVVGAGSGQEELASAAKESVNTINRLTEIMKRGAASLGSSQPEAQVKYLVEAIILLTVFVL